MPAHLDHRQALGVRLKRAARALLIALIVCAGLRPASAAQEPEPDLEAYTVMVREAAIAARRGDRIGLEEAGARLAAVTAVRVEDGTLLPADNRWLAAELARPTPDMRLLAERLGALADTLSLPPGAAPADARERLQQILSRPPFDREAAAPSWWNDLAEWLIRLIERMLRPAGDLPTGQGQLVGWVLGIGGAMLLAGILVYLVLGLRRSIVRGRSGRVEPPEEHMSAQEAARQAGSRMNDGDTRMAVRYMYLAALLWLDERKLLRYDRTLTNREYLDRVRDHPELQQRLAQIISTFDRVWYGHESLSEEDYVEYARCVEQLQRPERAVKS